MENAPSLFTPRYTTNRSSVGSEMTLATSFCCWVFCTSCTLGLTWPMKAPSL